MMDRFMITQEMLKRIHDRQARFRWGDPYLPGTFAVPREAPKISRVSRVNSRRLGRTLHFLSIPERVFAQLALFNPRLFDLHEQKMLQPFSHPHPLHGHPLAKGLDLKPVVGTVAITERIGMKHAGVVVTDDNGRSYWDYPYIGDLLLYLIGEDELPYAINWTIKLSSEDFLERRRNTIKTLRQQIDHKKSAELRNLLEEEYYLSAGIRTVKLSMEDIDPVVASNLNLLYGSHDLLTNFESALLDDYSGAIREAAASGRPLAPIAIAYGKKWGMRDLFLSKIYQDIWDRKIEVNLFEHILIDRPLECGGRNLLELYSSFFDDVSP
jgi:hypothetical protein